ncbi:MAG: hypothetical protein IPJ81_03860 [Chitinophagaceae bacterium]|nr:hypothetical protein [Chitinophagaceae bacterium]
MAPQKILNKIIALEAIAVEFKEQATGLRSELERFYAPAPKRGKKKVLSVEQEAALIMKRNKRLFKIQ